MGSSGIPGANGFRPPYNPNRPPHRNPNPGKPVGGPAPTSITTPIRPGLSTTPQPPGGAGAPGGLGRGVLGGGGGAPAPAPYNGGPFLFYPSTKGPRQSSKNPRSTLNNPNGWVSRSEWQQKRTKCLEKANSTIKFMFIRFKG